MSELCLQTLVAIFAFLLVSMALLITKRNLMNKEFENQNLRNDLSSYKNDNNSLQQKINELKCVNEKLLKSLESQKHEVSFMIESRVEDSKTFFKNSQKIKIFQRICIDKVPTPVAWEVFSQELCEVKYENLNYALE